MGRDVEAGLGGGEGEIPEPGAGAAFEGRAVAAEAGALRRVGGEVGHGVDSKDLAGVGGNERLPMGYEHIHLRAIAGDGRADGHFVDREEPAVSEAIEVHGSGRGVRCRWGLLC